jgi:hypothetical protein
MNIGWSRRPGSERKKGPSPPVLREGVGAGLALARLGPQPILGGRVGIGGDHRPIPGSIGTDPTMTKENRAGARDHR